MTGYSIGEYIRYRRLYLAAFDIIADKEKIIDIAYQYGYETPESFTKAFTRFHGVSPTQIKKETNQIKMFLPLKIRIEIQGGHDMSVQVSKMDNFKVIGFERMFSIENAIEQTILKCSIAEFGICIDDMKEKGKFRYMIAGYYNGEEVPEGMSVYEFQDMEWAKFQCVGPMPAALQSVHNQIFKEWLPGNPDYEVAMYANVEWYSKGDMSAPSYESGIWIPVKKK